MPLNPQHLNFYTHALRTPLQAVRGWADLIEPNLPEAKLRRYTAHLRHDILRLARLVDELNLQAELASAEFALNREPTRLPPLLFDLAHTFHEHFPEQRLQMKFPHALPLVNTDGERVRQVLWQLLTSAAQAAPRPAATVQVTVTLKHGLHFRVRDAGPRVPQKYHRVIFEPISAWPTTLRRSPHAHRWGLATAHQLAQQLSGTLRLEARRPQPYNYFVFSLPKEHCDALDISD